MSCGTCGIQASTTMQGDTGVPAGAPQAARPRCPYCKAFVTQDGAPCQNSRCPAQTGWTRRLTEDLVARLRSPASPERAAAARALGETRNRQHLGVLVDALSDAHHEVRQAAVAALGQLGAPAAVVPLAGVLGDYAHDSALSGDAARELGRLGGRQAVRALGQALSMPAPSVRQAAAESLVRLSASAPATLHPLVERVLLPGLQDQQAEVRRAVAAALGRCGGPRALSQLAARWDREDDALVRCAMARAAGHLAATQSNKVLPQEVLAAALTDPVVDVRLAGVQATSRLPETARLALLQQAQTDSAAEVRAAAGVEMWRFSPGPPPPVLAQMLQDPSPVAQMLACAAFRRYGGPADSPLLVPVLQQTPDDDVAAAAAEALGHCQGPEAIPALSQVAAAGPPARQTAAIRGLDHIGGPEAVAALTGLLTRVEDPWQRRAVVEALGNSGREQASAALITVLQQDEADHVRQQAALALGRTGGAAAAAALLATVSAEQSPPQLRAAAIEALGRLGGAELAPTMQAVLQRNPAPMLREAVVEALGRAPEPAPLALLAQLVQDDDRRVRLRAATRLSQVGGALAVPVLTTALEQWPEGERRELRHLLSLIAGQGGDQAAPGG